MPRRRRDERRGPEASSASRPPQGWPRMPEWPSCAAYHRCPTVSRKGGHLVGWGPSATRECSRGPASRRTLPPRQTPATERAPPRRAAGRYAPRAPMRCAPFVMRCAPMRSAAVSTPEGVANAKRSAGEGRRPGGGSPHAERSGEHPRRGGEREAQRRGGPQARGRQPPPWGSAGPGSIT